MLPTKFWAEMSWRDFADAEMGKVVAVLPVAAIEQHGPHLPVGVDTFLAEGYLKRAVARVPADLPVLFLPLQAIGKSNEHSEFPGTLTFSMRDLDARLDRDRRERRADRMPQTDLHEFARRQFGRSSTASRGELRSRRRMLAVNAAWRRLGYPEGMFSARASARTAFTAATPRPR